MASPAQTRHHSRHVESRRAAAGDREDAAVHLDQHHQRATVGEVGDLGRQRRDAVHVARPANGGHQHRHAAHVDLAGGVQQRSQQGAMVLVQRRVQEAPDQPLVGAVAGAKGQRLDVSKAGGGIGQRAGVLVDAQRQRGGLGRGRLDRPLGEDPGHRRRERPVGRDHQVVGRNPVRRLAAVMVEQHRLDAVAFDHLRQLAQPSQIGGLDDDHTPHAGEVAAGRVVHIELRGVQADELAHVAVQSAVQQHCRLRVKPTSRQHSAQGVEIRVLMGDDHLGRPHATSVFDPPVGTPRRGVSRSEAAPPPRSRLAPRPAARPPAPSSGPAAGW